MAGMNGIHKPRKKKSNGMNGTHKPKGKKRAAATKRRGRVSKRKRT